MHIKYRKHLQSKPLYLKLSYCGFMITHILWSHFFFESFTHWYYEHWYDISYLSANCTFSLWCMPLIKSEALNWPWFTIRRKTHYDITDKNHNVSSDLISSTDIITNIPALPIGLADLLAIISVSTFKIAVILYVSLLHVNLLADHFYLMPLLQINWLVKKNLDTWFLLFFSGIKDSKGFINSNTHYGF